MKTLDAKSLQECLGGGDAAVADIAQFHAGYVKGSLSMFLVGPQLGTSIAIICGAIAAILN